jgi:hypothetical protein
MLERNMTTIDSLTHLTDDQLVARVHMLASDERRATVALISTLVEFDARRLYLREGCSSLFSYCTQVLHLSEHAAYGRIEAARAARRFPVLLGRRFDRRLLYRRSRGSCQTPNRRLRCSNAQPVRIFWHHLTRRVETPRR